MKKLYRIILFVALVGCGPTSSGQGGADGGPTVPDAAPDRADAGPVCAEGAMSCDQLDVVECIDGAWQPIDTCIEGEELCETGACEECAEQSFNIETKQACAVSVLPGFELDAESFITIQNTDHRVLAMDRWGAGHIMAWCDSTTLGELLLAFDAAQYLGQVPVPRVASFGHDATCTENGWPGSLVPGWVEYLGEDLPAHYRDDADQLANDWDVVIFCGHHVDWAYDWSTEIEQFVAGHGKGFLAVMDYQGVVTFEDFENMNLITAPAGIQFEALNLPWAPSSTDVVLDCVPDVPIVN